ncbi:unnamed protein product, partial [Phaeothamnion confervicola]
MLGVDWDPNDVGTPAVDVLALAADEIGNLYAGTAGRGVYGLRPDEAEWRQLRVGLEKATVTALEVFDEQVFAGTDDERVMSCTNGGRHWHAVGHFPVDARPVRCVALAGDGELFAGTHRGVMRWNAATDAW